MSTEPVGKYGYMSWDEIKEIENSKLGFIGHHSHTHEYLIDLSEKNFKNDIETQLKFFKKNLDIYHQFFLILLENILFI